MNLGIESLYLTGHPTTSKEGEGTRGTNKSSQKEKQTLQKVSQRTKKRVQAGDSPLLPGSKDKGDLPIEVHLPLGHRGKTLNLEKSKKLGPTLERGSL